MKAEFPNIHFCQERGARRQMLLKELKEILEKVDRMPCVPPKCKVTRYPDFLGPRKNRFKYNFEKTPLITHVSLLEIRPTSDYRWLGNIKYPHIVFSKVLGPQKTHSKAPWDKPRYDSVEIRGGRNLYGCECILRNGLQHTCPRSDCEGRPICLTPQPICCPSTAMLPQPLQKPRPQMIMETLEANPPNEFIFCCCPDVKHGAGGKG